MWARPTGIHVEHILEEGEILNLGRLQVQVFAMPGHTAGSAAFLADGVLYLGDSADSNIDGTMRPAFWFVSVETDLNVASLKSLAAQLQQSQDEVKYLTFSHSCAREHGAADGLCGCAPPRTRHDVLVALARLAYPIKISLRCSGMSYLPGARLLARFSGVMPSRSR